MALASLHSSISDSVMSTHSLYPPNHHLLSDTVVGYVLQCTRPPRSSYVECADKTTFDINVLSSPKANLSKNSKKTATSKELRNEYANLKIAAKSRHGEVLPSIGDEAFLVANVVDLTTDDTMLTSQEPRRRERCHMSYRKKQEQLMKDLKEYNQSLQQEVWGLEFRRYAALLSTPTEQTVWTIALEYFRIFRYGLNDTTETNYPCASKFLGTTMARDVTDGSMCGPEAILNNWRLFSHNFDDILLELGRLEK